MDSAPIGFDDLLAEFRAALWLGELMIATGGDVDLSSLELSRIPGWPRMCSELLPDSRSHMRAEFGTLTSHGGRIIMGTNWSQDTEDAIVAVLGLVPDVGSLLGGLVEILWPQQNSQNVWDEIKEETEQLINRQISQEVYGRVQSSLGIVEQNSGLIGVVNNYLGAVNKTNGQDPNDTWIAANTTFINASGSFEQDSYEILLLPLFAQMANMHLALLRDGVQQGFCATSELQLYIKTYSTYASQWSIVAIGNSKEANPGNFNPANQTARFIQLNVGSFSQLWPYYDTTVYPSPVTNIPFPQEIFYTISEMISANYYPKYDACTPAGALFGNINKIDIAWLASDNGPWNFVNGCWVYYDSGQAAPYSGTTTGSPSEPGPPPTNKQYEYASGTWHIVETSVQPGNPITSINGLWDASQYISYIQFVFADHTSTRDIPPYDDDSGDGTCSFTISPPPGYGLTSMAVIGGAEGGANNYGFYYAAWNIIFGYLPLPGDVMSPDSNGFISVDSQNWTADCPIQGSLVWVDGYSVQYALAWIYRDGTLSNLGPWCDPVSGGPRAMPTLTLLIMLSDVVVGRQIWRKFAGQSAQLIATINDTSTEFYVDTNDIQDPRIQN